jgi:hypothetical protein
MLVAMNPVTLRNIVKESSLNFSYIMQVAMFFNVKG